MSGGLLRRWVMVCLVGFVAWGRADALAQNASRRSEEPQSLLRAKSPLNHGDLEVLETSTANSSPRRQPVTDLAVRLKASRDIPISVALSLDNADQRLRGRSIFQLDLMLVTGGRLLVEERAECRAWQGDVSICDAECDGGQIALLRSRGTGRLALRLIIGSIADTERDSLSSAVKLAACSDRDRFDLSLSPRRGLRRVEIELGGP